MLEWKHMTGDEKLREEIERVKTGFDEWFKQRWGKRGWTRKQMLGEQSPVKHIADKMTKTFEEVKELYPHSAQRECDMCGKYVDEWIETEFSFCNEYDCGMALCEDCLKALIEKRSDFQKEED